MRWSDLRTGRADRLDGAEVEIAGWMAPTELAERHSYFLLTPEPICCLACLPSDPEACIEVFARTSIPADGRPLRLIGRLARLVEDPAGWCYQMRDARPVEGTSTGAPVTRRELMAASAALALGAHVRPASAGVTASTTIAQATVSQSARALVASTVTVDIHSHAGRIINPNAALGGVAEPMRDGGMSVVCLAMVADRPVTRVLSDGRIAAFRSPSPGELYGWSQTGFARVQILIESEKLQVVTDTASLHAARTRGPSIVVAAEGADFLEGALDRLEEAYVKYRLRHLQLTHYRVNELGDIQTEAPVHGGLTDFGAQVIQTCNRLGIVADVAHGTYDLVKRAAEVTKKPLVLSHTSLSDRPGSRSRLISAEHARVIAGTGGVIGIWPPTTFFADKAAMAQGIARMADVVGVDHVGIGSDMLGLTSPSVFSSYRELPEIADALLTVGFKPDEATKILGGNYSRVFAASIG
jgi:membrane dipeptidase